MFIKRCFIKKNTLEMCLKLENIGYIRNVDYEGDLPFLYADYYETIGPYYSEANYGAPKLEQTYNKFIDCGENEKLFLAIAALQDDSDMDQWFVYVPTNKKYQCVWYQCIYDNIEKAREEAHEYYFSKWFYECHKATVAELIEHFKNEY